MQPQTQSKVRTERGTTYLIVPYQGGEIKHVFPSIGPNTYQEVGNTILAQGNQVPHGDYTASLLHAAYCDKSIQDEPECQNVRDCMRDGWLRIFNKNLWTPKGVYVVQDEKVVGLSQKLDPSRLEKMLRGGKEINGIRFSRDGKVRFAPKELCIFGEHTPEELAKNGFIIASFGEEGAEKLGEVSAKFRDNPKIWKSEFADGQDAVERLSAVTARFWDCFRLHFNGYHWDDLHGSRAFGVSN